MARGIDYGMGQTNIDRETGIRFGIISSNHEDLTEWLYESLESDYGPATCGHCGNEATEFDSEKHEDYETGPGCSDWACDVCCKVFDSSDAYGDEPIGHTLSEDGYEGNLDSSGDLWLFKSPYFTRAGFCSPCAPGACHLESPDEEGERAYCLGHDWFRSKRAPYPVYSVATGELVNPPTA